MKIQPLIAVVWLAGLVFPGVASADIAPVKELVPHIAIAPQGTGLLVTIDNAGGRIKASAGPDGLLLTYPGPLASINTDALVAKAGGRLASIAQGYDTILISGENLLVSDTSEIGGHIKALFAPTAGQVANPDAPATAVTDTTRLPLTRALISTDDGDYANASDQYESLLASTPATPEILDGYAQNEEEHGNWRHAYWLYEQSLERDPEGQDAAAGAQRIAYDHSRFVGTDAEYRDLQGFGIVYATTTTAAQPVTEGIQALAQYDAEHISTGSARRLDGEVLPAHQWSEAQSVGASYDGEDGLLAEGWIYDSYKVGTGGSVSVPTPNGHVIAGGEFDRADWDYLEGLVNNGTRDRLYVEDQMAFNHDFSGVLTLGYNYHNLGNQRNLANGPTASGELRYHLVHDEPTLDVVYALDAEYDVRSVNRIDQTGSEYKPFPLINREVHTVVLESESEVGRLLDYVSGIPNPSRADAARDALVTSDYGVFNAYVGAGDDRYGQPGPLIGGSWTRRIDPLEFQLRASYERGLDRESQSGTVAGGYLKVRF